MLDNGDNKAAAAAAAAAAAGHPPPPDLAHPSSLEEDEGPLPSSSPAMTTTEPPPRRWWQGHWSPLWVMGTTYLLLFVAYLGLAELGHKPAAFALHSLLALTFILACAANLFHTPSHGAVWRRRHVWMGWTALASGTAVVFTGYYMVFRPGYATSISGTAQTVFVITGTLQLVLQAVLLYAIRIRKSPWMHMVCASFLFYAAALMPALNRLPQILHFQDSDAFTFAIMPLGAVWVYLSIRHYSKTMKPSDTV